MCRIDYCGEDGGKWLKEPHVVKAKKDHTCGDCGRQIAKGEQYTYAAWLWEGQTVIPIKMCAQCIAAGAWLRAVCNGHLYPGVVEELREHWDEEWNLRSFGLGRLVVAGERKWKLGEGLVPIETISRWAEDGVQKARLVGAVGRATAMTDSTEYACACPASGDERRSLHRTGCPVYCQRCDLQIHTCGGCGADIPHGSGSCEDCRKGSRR